MSRPTRLLDKDEELAICVGPFVEVYQVWY
jgi:hypothetical protein